MWWFVSRSIKLPLGGSVGSVSQRHLSSTHWVSSLKPQYAGPNKQTQRSSSFGLKPKEAVLNTQKHWFSSFSFKPRQAVGNNRRDLSSVTSESVMSLSRPSVLQNSKRHNTGLDGPEARLSGAPKQEMIARQMANDNPFDNYTFKPEAGVGLFESLPVLIPSVEDTRVIGCCCEDDYQDIVWFTLEKGKVQKCDCGNYFKLIDHDPLDPNVKPKYGSGFGSGLGSMYY